MVRGRGPRETGGGTRARLQSQAWSQSSGACGDPLPAERTGGHRSRHRGEKPLWGRLGATLPELTDVLAEEVEKEEGGGGRIGRMGRDRPPKGAGAQPGRLQLVARAAAGQGLTPGLPLPRPGLAPLWARRRQTTCGL